MEIRVRNIIEDEEYLRQISKPVDFNNKEYMEDIEILKKYCSENECLALAAIQVGIPKRIIYLKNTVLEKVKDKDYNEEKILINPVIKSQKGHTKFWEACLSCLDYTGLVSRAYEIELEYLDINGEIHSKMFEGFEATVLSHELDHLDGILHIDIAEEILNISKEERKVFRETHHYEIISKTCDYENISNKNN